MSTRATIKINAFSDYGEDNPNTKELNYYLYHHHDGYPSGVGKELIDLFTKILTDTTDASYLGHSFLDTFPRAYRDVECSNDKELRQRHSDCDYHYDVIYTSDIKGKFGRIEIICYRVNEKNELANPKTIFSGEIINHGEVGILETSIINLS